MNTQKNPTKLTGSEPEEERYVNAFTDPVFVLVCSKAGVSLVVGLPTNFESHRGKRLDAVTEAELSAPSTTGYVRVLAATLQGCRDDDEATICFKDSILGTELKVPGICMRACSPNHILSESGAAIWTLPIFSCSMLLELHYMEVSQTAAKIPVVESGTIYRDSHEAVLFVVSGTEPDLTSNDKDTGAAAAGRAVAAAAPSVDPAGTVSCPLCSLTVPLKMMHNHMGAHILLEPEWSKYKPVGVLADWSKPAMPCGLCGIRSAVMCGGPIAEDQVVGCPVSASKVKPPSGGPATLRPNHQCKLLVSHNVRELVYSLAQRGKSVVSSPCTNRPVMCPVCSMYCWSYSMEAHVAEGNCRGAKGGAVVASCAPAHHEREWLVPFLSSAKSKLKNCALGACPCKLRARKAPN
jgi:hypothetical protein